MTATTPGLAIVTGAALTRLTDLADLTEQVARVAAAPCLPDAGDLTGQTVHVNGGGYLP